MSGYHGEWWRLLWYNRGYYLWRLKIKILRTFFIKEWLYHNRLLWWRIRSW